MCKKAEKLLSLAATYAGDGGTDTVIYLTEQAIELLKKERARREKLVQKLLRPRKSPKAK
jgi:predicted peroxiredoxin